ncbi:ABC transporter substrate-binding protein [Aquibium sp. A9E412]|uniref:ABC transporter substrate-binding protein n=1 Tax=Aquibium sp. A9E412 TaxID=2976767 RepID=UPI0025B08E71|nr:ABC transporter substrate-binding protein [Aquibium sp. A9E412]MDN2567774.1 ABC transporter substrate-binding protein [Aquibium sp. A9E412]
MPGPKHILTGALVALATFAVVALQGAAMAQTRGGTLTIGWPHVVRSLNPAVSSGVATGVPAAQIFASLLRYDDDWNPQPYLAERWEVSEDGLTVTVTLVEGAVFHDGEPITSQDVKFSIEAVKENHPFATMFAPVTGIETPDARTAVIRLSAPHPAILTAMSGVLLPIIPEHVYGDGQELRTHPANVAPVGSGPFELVEFIANERIVLKRFDDFFIDGRPYLDEMVFRINPDPVNLVLLIENGDVDMLPLLGEPHLVSRLKEKPGITVTDQGYEALGASNWVAFNLLDERLKDKRVRQAIAYAIDRDFIVNALHRGATRPATGPLPEGSQFYTGDVNLYEVDLDKANALLDEAGYPQDDEGVRFELTLDYIPGLPAHHKLVAEYVATQLRKVGLKVSVRNAPDFPTWSNRVANWDFDMTIDGAWGWGDPVIGNHRTYLSDNIRKGVIWSNTQNYASPDVDALLAKAAVEMDSEARRAQYAEFQKIVTEDLPVYGTASLAFHTAYRDIVKNPPTSVWGPMSPMDALYLEPAAGE